MITSLIICAVAGIVAFIKPYAKAAKNKTAMKWQPYRGKVVIIDVKKCG